MAMQHGDQTPVRLVVPSKGVLEAPTLAFLAQCGLGVSKSNARQYLAAIPVLPQVSVLFQRVADIVTLVEQGAAELGITGYDVVAERRGEDADGEERTSKFMVLHRDLGYGACDLVLAVPETWVDVQCCRDLAEVSAYYREKKGRSLRIATKYPELTRAFLASKGMSLFQTVVPQGALEAAPAIGLADMIADLTQTGITLRENHLRVLEDGVILHSQACLIGNTRAFAGKGQALATAVTMLELIDATRQARKNYLLTAAIRGESASNVVGLLNRYRHLFGQGRLLELQIAPLAPVGELSGGSWFTVSVVIASAHLLEAVNCLRRMGAERIQAVELAYQFTAESSSVKALTERLKRGRDHDELLPAR
jgi:ATP phosphoribosyltransferase